MAIHSSILSVHGQRNLVVVQWLRLDVSTAGGISSIPGWGTKILHASRFGKKEK